MDWEQKVFGKVFCPTIEEQRVCQYFKWIFVVCLRIVTHHHTWSPLVISDHISLNIEICKVGCIAQTATKTPLVVCAGLE